MLWSPASWKSRPILQQPIYPDRQELETALVTLSRLPPLVTSWEIESLKAQLAKVATGEMFLLQGGDCAERFEDCAPSVITNKLKILLQMSLVLVHGSRKRVIRVGRIAGQYAKPRSSDPEVRDGISLPAYRGDLINRAEFAPEARRPDPSRLVEGYGRSALTLNFIRALIAGGFADLHHPEYWDLDFVEHSPHAAEYQDMVRSIGDSLLFMETLAGQAVGEIDRVDFFTSHEGLHLLYEEAHTRRVPHREGWYNLDTHFPWIGMRTADVGGAHVEYFRGLANPIGIKVGPSMSPEWLADLLEILDPRCEPGRLTLIHRFGADRVAECLPPLIDVVRESRHRIVWCCDPMHGNTRQTREGIKTRSFADIVSELEQSFAIHAAHHSYPGGVHIELTGENVTECVGGARGLREEDLGLEYHSRVDPRLNYEQALEIAMLIARRLGRS